MWETCVELRNIPIDSGSAKGLPPVILLLLGATVLLSSIARIYRSGVGTWNANPDVVVSTRGDRANGKENLQGKDCFRIPCGRIITSCGGFSAAADWFASNYARLSPVRS